MKLTATLVVAAAALLPVGLAAQPPAVPSVRPAHVPQASRTLAEEALLSSSGAPEPAPGPGATDDAQVAREIARLKQLAREGQLDAARADADALVSRFPHEACAYAIRGLFSAEAKDFARANGDLDQALSLAPTSGVIRFGRARVLNRQGRTDEAIEELKKCAELPAANQELVGTLHRLTRTQEAKQYAEQLVSLRPKDAKTLELLAQVESWCGNHEAAFAAASKAIELAPEAASAWQLRGQLLLGRDNVASAADYAEAIRRTSNPGDRATQFALLASLAFVDGDYESANLNISAALRVDPTCADYLSFRAGIRGRERKLEEARADLSAAIGGIVAGTMRVKEEGGLIKLYQTRAKVATLLGDREGADQDRAEAERLETESANKEARKP